jgi:cytosine/adenosine deaminase-related metal-dependent hydrolase
VGTPQQFGNGSDVVVFDDWLANGNLARASNLSGLRLVAAGRTAILFLATSAGLRAVRLGSDGSFAPEKVDVANTP